MTRPTDLWTIDELGSLVADALAAADYHGPKNGQVRAVPNRRTIRYYTTLGLLDRPAEMRGRTAYYGRRHLLQLVAIKRLQEQGMSLADVQVRLSGLNADRLEAIADISKEVGAAAARPSTGKATAEPSRRADFWLSSPADIDDDVAGGEPEGDYEEQDAEAGATAVTLTSIDLWPGVTVLVHTPRPTPIQDGDVRALRAAAEPLIAELRTCGILDPL